MGDYMAQCPACSKVYSCDTEVEAMKNEAEYAKNALRHIFTAKERELIIRAMNYIGEFEDGNSFSSEEARSLAAGIVRLMKRVRP